MQRKAEPSSNRVPPPRNHSELRKTWVARKTRRPYWPITNLILGSVALIVYLLTKQSYANSIGDLLIEFFRQNILLIAFPLAIAKPLLTSAFGLPDASWSIAKQRTFALVRTVISIALLMAVTVVPLYAAGVHETIYVFLRDRLLSLSLDLPRFRGEVRSWDQRIWFDGILSSSFE